MATSVDIQQELLQLVRTQNASGPLTELSPASQQGPGSSTSDDQITELTRELDALRRQLGAAEETARKQADILDQNTAAVLQSSNRSAAASTASDVVSSVRSGGGLFNSPLLGLIGWLSNRGGSDSPPELPAFSRPDPIDANLGFAPSRGAGLDPVGYSGEGLPRSVVDGAPASRSNITIQVQTMDSRSFLDNSDQIARAVREAMLNSHAINDVIGEM